nr:hypothetical protein [Tanacetum cinerariifolium]
NTPRTQYSAATHFGGVTLNPNKFDQWKIRIEQYFLMTDYSLWEVILNGDSPTPTRVIEGVVQHVSPTTAKQRLARKNKLKAHGNLLIALPDKHQLKFNIHKDAKTLMEAIEKRFGGNKETKKDSCPHLEEQDRFGDLEEQSLDDLFNSLKIYEAEVKSSSSASTSTQNIDFVSFSNTDSTNEPISAAASVFAVSAKIPVSALPNIDADDLEEMDLKWQMAMLTVECYNCDRKVHFVRKCRFPKDTRRNGAAEPQRRNVPVETSTSNALVFQCDGVDSYDWSFQADEEPTNYALMALHLQVLLMIMRYQSGSGYHDVPPPYTGTFMPPKPDLVFHNAPNADETVHTAFNPNEQVKPPRPSDKHVKTSIPADNPKTAILKPKSHENSRNRKVCFVCKILTHLIKDCDFYEKKIAQTTVRNHAQMGNHKQYARMKLLNPQRHVVPTTVLTQSRLVPITAVRPVTTVVPKTNVTGPRQARTIVTKTNSPPRRHINRSPSPKASNFPLKVTAVKATMVNVVHDVQGK